MTYSIAYSDVFGREHGGFDADEESEQGEGGEKKPLTEDEERKITLARRQKAKQKRGT